MTLVTHGLWRVGRWTPFDPQNYWTLPKVAVVYAVYFDSELVYVGQTRDLRARFHQHQFGPVPYGPGTITPWGILPKGATVTAKAKRTRRFGEWAMIELRLIKRLKPRHNVTHLSGRRAKRYA